MKKHGCFLYFFLISWSAFSYVETKVIYDEDDRGEFFEIFDETQLINALSSVALVSTNRLTLQENFYSFPRNQHGKKNNICSSERFLDQTSLSFCSGALVTNQHILTAGHCVEEPECANISFVFRYRLSEENLQTTLFPLNNVYSCEKVEYIRTMDFDIALLKMDRPVDKNLAFPLKHQSPQEPLSENDRIYMIGHPDGLPQKIADGAVVRSVNHFHALTNLDAYRGNSGSPVFNDATDLIEGVLIFGEKDYVKAPGKSCYLSKVCKNEECLGEAVAFIPQDLSDLIHNINNSSKVSFFHSQN